ncbi:MAG: hypothetical protein HZB95_10090 [Nitrosomonadales bacterium]|nr:hypothetical protein [Nitrosomonadales bacterium]
MKRAVRVVVLGAMLQGSAQAGEQDAAVQSSPNKGQDRVASVQQGAPEAKKQKTVHGKKSAAKAKPAKPAKDDPLAKEKQEGAMEAPAEQVEQSVQLKGVRG